MKKRVLTHDSLKVVRNSPIFNFGDKEVLSNSRVESQAHVRLSEAYNRYSTIRDKSTMVL